MAEASGMSRPTPREVLVAAAHLLALWTLAFVQPLLDLLGSNPDFFVARGNTSADILILAFGFTLLPALVMAVILTLAAAVGRGPFTIVYRGLVVILVAFLAVQLLERLLGFDGLPAILTALVGFGLGGLAAWGLARGRFVKALLDVLSVAPLVVLALFIFNSPASRLILPQEEAKALSSTGGRDVPVVMVIFDELPAVTLLDSKGGVDADRYPGFARLASESTWFPNATTVADFTGRAVPAILTGLTQDGTKLPIAADQPLSIFTLLGGTYDLNVRESVTRLCPDSLCDHEDAPGPGLRSRLKALVSDLKYVEGRLVLPAGWADRLPEVSTTFGDFGGSTGKSDKGRAGEFVKDMFEPPSPAELAAFVDEIPAGGRTLNLIHMELPHEPFRYLPDGRRYNETSISTVNGPGGQWWSTGTAGIATAQQRHYLQVGYADRLVDTLINRLKRLGLWREAMVIVTADHGISFTPGVPRRIAVPENIAGVANPPLFIKYPGQVDGAVSEQLVRTIDVLPTIVDQLKIRGAYEMEGEPIPPPGPGSQAGSNAAEGGTADREAVVLNGYGEEVEIDREEMLSQREEILQMARQRLGEGGLFTLGPRPNLVGTPAPPYSEPAEGSPRAELATPGMYRKVDPESEPLPLFVTGTLDGVEPPSLIAIAVNGRIAATTRAFRFREAERFGAVVPPDYLRPGANEVTIYMVSPEGALTPLGSNG